MLAKPIGCQWQNCEPYFAVGKNAAYLDCPTGIRDSKAALGLLGKAGKFATTRNLATVLKLKALANDAEA